MTEKTSGQGASQRGARYPVLLTEAVPELCRVNAFRLTQLPVSATQREIARQVDKIRMAEKLGVAVEQPGGVLPLPGGAGADSLREALQRLRDPEKHLIDELFWFWPLKNGDADDAGLSALKSDDRRKAALLWMGAHGDAGRTGAVALHNLAVLALVGVLDSEFDELAGTLDDERRRMLPELWSATFERWNELRKTRAFWTALEHRVEEIADPRLTDAVVWDIRKTLPEALAGIAARMATALFTAGRPEACRRIFASLWASDLPQADIKRAVRGALEPIRTRLKAGVESADAEFERDRSGNRPLEIAGRLLEQCDPLLLTVDAALPEGDPTRAGLHDDIALSLLGLTIAWVNATDNYQGAKSWYDRSLGLAEGEAAIERISENRRINADNLAAKKRYEQAAPVRSPVRAPAPPSTHKERGGFFSCGVIIGIIVLVIVIGSAISHGCDSSSPDSTSTLSAPTYDGSDSGSSSTTSETTSRPYATYYDRAELADLFKKVWAAHSATPQTLSKPYPSLSRKLYRLEKQIRKWTRDYDTNAGTRRVANEGARFAAATAAWYKDPFSDAKFSAYKRAYDQFYKHIRKWSP